jgi:hypothetical protein
MVKGNLLRELKISTKGVGEARSHSYIYGVNEARSQAFIN